MAVKLIVYVPWLGGIEVAKPVCLCHCRSVANENSCVVGVCVFQEELEYVDRVYSLCFADVDDAYVAER